MATCNKCGWVHFEMSRAEAEASVVSFNEYYDGLTIKEQQDYYGGHKSSIDHYDRCFRCGNNYEDFRDTLDGDCPMGSTIQPIIDRND